jgi:hypothetical protein
MRFPGGGDAGLRRWLQIGARARRRAVAHDHLITALGGAGWAVAEVAEAALHLAHGDPVDDAVPLQLVAADQATTPTTAPRSRFQP